MNDPEGLANFLEARTDEDEKAAKGDLATNYLADLRRPVPRVAGEWDPVRRLRECEAKRKIVEFCRVAQEDSWAGGRINDPTRALAEEVLTALAQVYADHEQFREEWQE